MKNRNKNIVRILVCLLVTFSMVFGINLLTKNNENDKLKKELIRSQSYRKLSSNDDAVDGTDYVKFSAFFLRDLDNNGVADKLYGTVNEVGTEDDLYFEINVLTDGYLKDGKIEIDNKNFYLATALPKDSIIKNEVFQNNTKLIEFNDINNGTQKLIKAFVRSGDYTSSYKTTDAIGDDKTNYSRDDNVIHFTGKYCPSEGECVDISKDINLEVDWYGDIYTKLKVKQIIYNSVDNNLSTIVKDDRVELSFDVITEETIKELLLKNNHIEITLPKFNGYDAIDARTTSPNATYSISDGKLIIERIAAESENVVESIASQNTYSIVIDYPKEAYTSFYDDDTESIELEFPISEYYEAYNNNKEPYVSPLKSNIANDTLKVIYRKYVNNPSGIYHDSAYVKVGSLLYYPFNRYAVSKSKPINIYNGYKTVEYDDDYNVAWVFNRGNDGLQSSVITLKESDDNNINYDEFIKSDDSTDSMQNITHYKAIKFGLLTDKFDEDGYIKVYNDDTDELLLTLTSENFDKYSSGKNTYYYNKLADHIRVEFYNLKESNGITINHIKEIDDSLLNETYSLDEFVELDKIKTTLNVYYGDTNSMTLTHEAIYEEPYSESKISISRNAYASYDTVNTDIRIRSEEYPDGNEIGWKNAIYLVKLPEEFMRTNINYVTIDNDRVEVLSYEYIENNDGKFIKIYTENGNIESYNININADITIVPKAEAGTKEIELFAENGESTLYYSTSEDLYDLNNNGLTNDIVNYSKTNISIVAPNTLITTEAVIEYDDTMDNEITIGPNTAYVDKSESTATVVLSVQNNYNEDVDDIYIQGKIPYVGNTSILSGDDLNSEFNTTMITGIDIPNEIKDSARVYLSTEENPTKDINDASNKWVLESEVTDFSEIKSYLIDLSDITMNTGDDYDFSYEISLPSDTEYNDKTYSTHAIYFSIETNSGKYKTSTEPAKVGIQIVKKYSIDFAKYHKNSIKLLPGATYSVSEVVDDGEGNERLINTKTGVSGNDGTFEIGDLFVNRTYVINEIRSPENYELNREPIRIYATVNEQNNVVITVISGDVRDEIVVDQGSSTKAYINIEDEVLAKLHINKIDQDTNLPLKNIKFKITGDNYSLGKIFTTDNNGDINISNLIIGSEYTLEETKATGYFPLDQITFTINNNSGNYTVDVTSGNVDSSSVSVDENSIPTVNFNISNQKMPTYTLNLYKIKNTTSVDLSQNENPNAETKVYIKGARFELYQGDKKIGEYETDDNGLISIPDLYAYTDGVTVDTTYTLKELKTPSGYSKVKDIVFRVNKNSGSLEFEEFLSAGQTAKDCTIVGDQVNIEVKDNPIFVITKKDNETDEVIANVKFAIFNIDNGVVPAVDSNGDIVGTKEIINGVEYYVVTTDANGQISIDLPEGLYKLVELDAGEKYNINDQEYYFGIGTEQETGKTYYREKPTTFLGGSGGENVKKVINTSDGGYLIYGTTASKVLNINDELYTIPEKNDTVYVPYFIKMNSNNEVEWINTSIRPKSYAEVNNPNIIQLDDGSYVYSFSASTSSKVLIDDQEITYDNSPYSMLVQITSDGQIGWKLPFYGNKNNSSNHINLYDMTKLSNGNIVVCGYIAGSYYIGNKSFYYFSTLSRAGIIAEISPEGQLIDKQQYQPSSAASNVKTANIFKFVKASNDGGYYALLNMDATTNKFNNVTYTMSQGRDLLVKFNSNNEVENTIYFKNSESTDLTDIEEIDDGILISYYAIKDITIGETTMTRSNSGGYDAFLVKINNSNEVDWYGLSGNRSTVEKFNDIYIGDDGKYYVVGEYNDYAIYEVFDPDGTGHGVIAAASSGELIHVVRAGEEGFLTVGYSGTSRLLTDEGVFYTNGGSDIFIYGTTLDRATSVGSNDSERNISDSEENLSSINNTSDGGYVVGGYTYSTYYSVGDYVLNKETSVKTGLVEKFDRDHNVQWVKALYGNNITVTNVKETAFGTYLVSGYQEVNYNDEIEGDFVLENNGNSDAFILELDETGNILWTKTFGGSAYDYARDITPTEDGGYVVVGRFSSNEMVLDETHTLTNANATSYSSYFIIKYNRIGEIEWTDTSSKAYYDYQYNSVTELSDGRIVAAGQDGGDSLGYVYSKDGEILSKFYSSMSSSEKSYLNRVYPTADGGFIVSGPITPTDSYTHDMVSVVDGVTEKLDIYTDYVNTTNGYFAKFDSTGTIEHVGTISTSKQSSGGWLYSMKQTQDGGYILVGFIRQGTLEYGKDVEGRNMSRNYYYRFKLDEFDATNSGNNKSAYILKLNSNFDPEWAQVVGGTSYDELEDVIQLEDGTYVAVGDTNSYTLNVMGEELKRKSGSSSYDGIIIKFAPRYNAEEKVELEVLNEVKKLKVTTEVIPIDGVKGGTISGEGAAPYEFVKYGNNSTNEIKIVPNADYEIMEINVNGEQYLFNPEEDGSYTMPNFENMTEDIHVQVKFAIKERKLTITKKDAYKNEIVEEEGIEFNIQQIDDRDPLDQSQIGELTDNGDIYTYKVKDDEVLNLMTNVVDNGTYTFVNEDGKLIPTNSKYYQLEHGGSSGIHNTTANSYIEIDLTNYTGNYVVALDANISSQSGDAGYAAITSDTTAPLYYSGTGRFIYANGEPYHEEYLSDVLEGGNVYYLHLGYYKNSSTDSYDDVFIVNSIKLYTYHEEETVFNFVNNNGVYESTNEGYRNSTCNSYIPIDLTNLEGDYYVVVNAEIDSESNDYGYANISTTTDRISNTSSTNRVLRISGKNRAASDYKLLVSGGQLYYLHIGYYKNLWNNYYSDKFKINSIRIELSSPNMYSVTATTNANGIASVQLPYGRYIITETKAPEGYFLSDERKEIQFRDSTSHDIIFEDNKKTEVIVHHYLKNNNGEYTEEKLADDEIIYGKVDDDYRTNPETILTYNLEKVNNEYVYPDNKDGKHTYETIEVNYYYEKGSIPLTVKHLIEGTNSKVPLKDGTKQEDIEDLGRTGDPYNTTPVSNDNLSDAYELSIVPDNANGTYGEEEILVTYYYKPVERNVTLHKTNLDGTINLEGVKFLIDGEEYTTNENGQINIKLGYGEHTYKEIETISGYELDDTEQTITITRESVDNQEINITNNTKLGKVIVHHYIKNTTNKVPLIAGGVAEDVTTEGEIGKLYGTDPIEASTTSYKLVSEDVEFKQGEYIDGIIEVTYYYEYPKVKYKVEYYYNNQIDNSLTDEFEADPGTEINSYEDKVKTGFELLEVKNYPLTIDEDETKNVIKVYYVSNCKITTDVIEHTEKYYDGTTASVKGGTISGEDLDPYESVEYNHDSTKNIIITPNEGYEVALVKVNNTVIDVTDYTDVNGIVTLNKDNGFFTSLTEDKHIEAEFKKKSKVTVKYLEYGTLTELETTIEQTGYQDEEYTTERKSINTYREKKVETTDGLSGVTINNGDKFDESITHVFTADDQEVIYWYEKIPNSTVVVKHIEIDNKGNSTILDEDSYENIIGTVINTSRQEFTDTVTGRNYYSIDGAVCEVCIDKNTDSYDATITENKVIEVKYFYQRSYYLTTENKTPTGGTISGDGLEKYEEIVRNGSNTKIVEIAPNSGYRIKNVKINNIELDITSLLNNNAVILPASYFTDVEDDIHIEVEFEKIPAKVIVEYRDKDTNEKLITDKTVEGFVGDPYNESKVDIDYCVFVGDSETISGDMTEEDTTIVFYYKKQFKITTDVIEHLESVRDEIVIPGNNINETQITVKGGTISGENETPYETVSRGNSSTKQIVIHADDNYIISEIKINNVKVDITNNKDMEIDTFENVQEDKHIEVKFERVTKTITVQYIDKDTGDIIEQIEKTGNIDDKYTTEKMNYSDYEYLESSDNVNGTLSDDVIVKYYYYKKIINPDTDTIDVYNPFTGDKISLYLIATIISLLVLIHFARKKNHRLRV